MEELIAITTINDFMFCPASIFFHGMYDGVEGLLYKESPQLLGTKAHRHIDNGTDYSKDIVSGIAVYSEQFGLIGKIDRYRISTRTLTECKRSIPQLYDGYVFQLYAQYFGILEAGFSIDRICLYDIKHNRTHPVALPEDNPRMMDEFIRTLDAMRNFDLSTFSPHNASKCRSCIYADICTWSLSG